MSKYVLKSFRYLWVYTAVLLTLCPLLRKARPYFIALRGARLLLVPVLPLLLYSLTLWPHFPPTHDLVRDGWLHAVYFTLFIYGCWIGLDAGLWAEFRRLRSIALALAGAAFLAHLALCSGWIAGFAAGPWGWLAWARDSVYPWYLLHQTLIIMALVWLSPLGLGPVIEPMLVLGLTVAGCWLLNDGLIRKSALLRPLFGLARISPTLPNRNQPRGSRRGASADNAATVI